MTSWDAFHSRGKDDFLGSHDLEDIISVVAGRPELAVEIAAADPELRGWLAEQTRAFLSHDLADYAIQGALPDAAVIPELLASVRSRFNLMK